MAVVVDVALRRVAIRPESIRSPGKAWLLMRWAFLSSSTLSPLSFAPPYSHSIVDGGFDEMS